MKAEIEREGEIDRGRGRERLRERVGGLKKRNPGMRKERRGSVLFIIYIEYSFKSYNCHVQGRFFCSSLHRDPQYTGEVTAGLKLKIVTLVGF